MDFAEIVEQNGSVTLTGVRHLDMAAIVESGQCFRWERTGENTCRGVALGRVLAVTQAGDRLTLHGQSAADFHRLWHHYFDFGREYGALKEAFAADDALRRAVAFSPGMRVLRQDPWETLVSFILSANNNIPRIRGIVERLCTLLGDPLGEGTYAFPRPERMAPLTEADLAPLRCGYRARYLLDAARLVASGGLLLDPLYTLPVDEARARLRAVCGVGPKVAECVLLYGFGRGECVPVDVWIDRALRRFYPSGMPPEIAPVAGIAQQYLFHYVRLCPDALAGEDDGARTPATV